jgi:ADP-L-glycero-D-manno-heptose 6-epimerase
MLEHPGKVDAVIHLGAHTSTTERDASVFRRLNLEYSQTLWHVCQQTGARLIYASSASTYGSGRQGFSDQIALSELRPLNLYAESKHQFDMWAAAQESGPKQHVGLKFFNVYGPNEYHKGPMASVIYQLANSLRREKRVTIFETPDVTYQHGNQARDFVYSKDVAQVIEFFLSNPGISGLFNLGTGKPRTFNDVAHAVAQTMGSELVIDYAEMPESMRAHYQHLTCAHMDKLRAAGYERPFRSLEQGVKDYVVKYLMRDDACLSVA